MEKHDKIYQYLATPVLTFNFEILKWTPTGLENIQTKMRTLLTRYRFHHPWAAKKDSTKANGWQMIDWYTWTTW